MVVTYWIRWVDYITSESPSGTTMSLTSCDGIVLENDIGSTFMNGFGPHIESYCLKRKYAVEENC